VVIASKQFAESLILAHMAAQLIEAKTDLAVDISKIGMGATEMLHPALVEGQIDLYPEYTGTAWMVVLEGDVIHDRQEIFEKTKAAYQEKLTSPASIPWASRTPSPLPCPRRWPMSGHQDPFRPGQA